MPNILNKVSSRFVVLSWLLLIPIGCTHKEEQKKVSTNERHAIPPSLQPLVDADKLTIFSIDGNDPPSGIVPQNAEYYLGYPVLGKDEITDKKTRNDLIVALAQSIDKGDYAKCFWPRHALRAEKGKATVNYLICFECNQIKIFADGETTSLPIASKPVEVFNQYLKSVGIARAPLHGKKEKKDEK